MQKSVFKKYFSICTSLILVSFVVLGVVLMLFSASYLRTEKYGILQSNVEKAVASVEGSVNSLDDLYQDSEVTNFLDILSEAIDADFFVTDLSGRTVYCTETAPCRHTTYTVSDTVRTSLKNSSDGVYREMGKLDNLYSENYFTVGKMLTGNSGVEGYVFSSMEAAQPTNDFLSQILKMFLISAVVVLIVVTIIIYFVTHQMVKPLKEMSIAAQEFGKGDFSKRLPVNNYDEIGQLAMALNNMAQSLSTLETMRRSFIANVSHELKTPMTTIGGFIDGILDGTIGKDEEKQYLRIVSDEVKRLARLVRSMLNLAQVEAGELQLNPERFDVVDTICQTLFSLERQIDAKHLEVRGLDHDKVWVEADHDLIHQVIYNLVENAIKFSNEGGYLEFEFQKEGSRTLIGVKNSGEGLSKEEIPRVFDRFYKTDRSRGLDKNGVGLGLYIVRSIVNLHGGEIMVKSVQGEYCEFLFSLQSAKPQSKFKKNGQNSKGEA
ncbi:MAG: HAMP domain-containing sensor histidine kinase [Massiliimalia sp.]